jgi:LytS/YehU family sensor histidine kinase
VEILIVALSLVSLISITALLVVIIRFRKIDAQNRSLLAEKNSLQNQLNSTELDGIKHKMNPHLFKNILNSIQSHAYQTYYSLDKLGNVLDYILYETDKKFVSVKDELDFATSLIEINKLKLSPLFDLQIKNKVDAASPLFTGELLAPMVTAELIENAFKHADTQSGDSFIAITFELDDTYFSLKVANKVSSKPHIVKTNSGFGREHTRKRLSHIYQECYSLQQQEENGVFLSHLKINLLEHKAKMPVA